MRRVVFEDIMIRSLVLSEEIIRRVMLEEIIWRVVFFF